MRKSGLPWTSSAASFPDGLGATPTRSSVRREPWQEKAPELPHHPLTGDVAPVAPGFEILHDQAVAPEPARDDQREPLLVDSTDVDHARVAKGSPGHGDRSPADLVVGDFVDIC